MTDQKSRESDLSLEVVILLIFGVFMLIFGTLLFSIQHGDLPYTPDSMYGLFLIIVSIQIITMGKTPFGDLRRSWMIIILGMCTAVLGMLACFIPGYLSDLIRFLVGFLLAAGGISLLFQLFVSEGKAKSWIPVPGVLRHLIIALSLVYLLLVLFGLVTLLPGIITDSQTGALLILSGISFLYLAWCLQIVVRRYPSQVGQNAPDHLTSAHTTIPDRFRMLQESSLPLSSAILILMGVLVILLGFLLFPVYLHIIPFSPDGQLGILLVITAIQMMALGMTPVGQYARSWLMVIIGIGFASMGVVSSIIPGMLTHVVQILLGVLNIAGGAIFLGQRYLTRLHDIKNPPAEPVLVYPILITLDRTQISMNCVSIIFGASMLLPGLIPIFGIGIILIVNGLLIFKLVSIFQKLP